MRKKDLRIVVISGGLLFLTGCGTGGGAYMRSMPPEAKQTINVTKVAVIVRRPEIFVDQPPTRSSGPGGILAMAVAVTPGVGVLGAGLAGAVGAGIDMAIMGVGSAPTSAEEISDVREIDQKKLVSVREVLRDYDFRADIQEALRQQLSTVSWLKVSSIEVVAEEDLPKLRSENRDAALLVVDALHYFPHSMKDIAVMFDVTLIERMRDVSWQEKLSDYKQESLYTNIVTYRYPFPGDYVSAEQAVNIWSSDKDRLIRELSAGVAEAAKLVAMDIDSKLAVKQDQTDKAAQPLLINVGGKTTVFTGVLVSKAEERAAVRGENGTLHSVPLSNFDLCQRQCNNLNRECVETNRFVFSGNTDVNRAESCRDTVFALDGYGSEENRCVQRCQRGTDHCFESCKEIAGQVP